MIAKMLLPTLGGTPAVWTTCMVFFQVMLLAGYAYAHAAMTWLGVRRQAMWHLLLVFVPILVLPPLVVPDAVGTPDPSRDPRGWLLGMLLMRAGLPFFVVSTSAPLFQRWFAETSHRDARDPYHLYAASNLGSLSALLAYPLVVEPFLCLSDQAYAWSIGYGLLVILTLTCGLFLILRSRPSSETCRREEPVPDGPRPLLRDWLAWIVLSFLPSSLLLGVTTYLTTDIAAVPLLWVIPLALYLLSFILTFSRQPILSHGRMLRVFPFSVILILPALGAGLVQAFWMPFHLLAFFLASMVCHGELARRRPPARFLTEFYLAIAFGGVAGGFFNALVAPIVFDRVAEYPLSLTLACLVLPFAGGESVKRSWSRSEVVIPAIVFLLMTLLVTDFGGLAESVVGVFSVMIASGLGVLALGTYRSRPFRFALTVGAVLLASGFSTGVDGTLLLRERNFFGAVRVTHVEPENMNRFFHGSTLHGQQDLDPARRRVPLTFFHRSGPIGQIFKVAGVRRSKRRVAVAGLGIGTLAAYARPDERWTFFELDPAVVRIARDPRLFTYLHDSRADRLDVVIGDARLRLRELPEHGQELIILDAFSSDAVPVHLLTRERWRSIGASWRRVA